MPKPVLDALFCSQSIIDQIDGNDIKTSDEGIGLPPGWPRKVWVVQFSNGTHGVLDIPIGEGLHADRVHGLACYKKKENAHKYIFQVKNVPLEGHKFVQLTFEEARKLAKTKPMPIVAMIRADNPVKPEVFFVK